MFLQLAETDARPWQLHDMNGVLQHASFLAKKTASLLRTCALILGWGAEFWGKRCVVCEIICICYTLHQWHPTLGRDPNQGRGGLPFTLPLPPAGLSQRMVDAALAATTHHNLGPAQAVLAPPGMSEAAVGTGES